MPNQSKEQRLYRLKRQVDQIERFLDKKRERSERWSLARLMSFLAMIILSSVSLFLIGSWLFWLVLVALGALFTWIVYVHRQLEESIARHDLWLRLQKRQLARMRLDWQKIPAASITAPHFSHPFEADFDLIGERSLHRLIDTSVTTEGSALLRRWLATVTPNRSEIEERQQRVRELVPLSLFRTRFLLASHRVLKSRNASAPNHQTQRPSADRDVEQDTDHRDAERWNPQRMLSWFTKSTPLAPLRRWMWSLSALALFNWLLVVLDFGLNRGRFWPYPLALYTILIFYATSTINRAGSGDLFYEAARLQDALQQLRQLFHLLETYSFRNAPTLKEICTPFTDADKRPSLYIRKLAGIANATGIRGNPLIWTALNLSLPWDILFAYQLEKCRRQIGDRMPIWLKVWFELEALSSLANLAYLNPNYVFPELLAADSADTDRRECVLDVKGIGHPLLPDVDTEQAKVRNDFSVTMLGEIGIITGSNMAGKSTFLRAVGMNLALAFAGGPTDANSFRTVPLRLFASIKVSDSVTDGVSYFYAEVQRLHALLEELNNESDLPLFFCIDEIFRGTNNRERLAGSQAYIQALVGKNGAGLISTHDLELVKLADQNRLIENYHFRDSIKEGKMVFDYRLRSGPCPTTNALKIMALAGLPVPSGD